MQIIIELKSKDEDVIHSSDEQKEQNKTQKRSIVDIIQQEIDKGIIPNWDESSVGQSSVIFYPKQKRHH